MNRYREKGTIKFRIASSTAPLQRQLILEEMPDLTARQLEKQGFDFGQWLYGEASTPFLRGLVTFIDEAELRKELGFGY